MKLKWFKLAVDLFENGKIKCISTLDNGRDIIIIWIKLLCFAAKKNDGGSLYFVEGRAPTVKELATVIDENAEVLSAALEVLRSFDMIRVSENGIPYIKNYSEFQWGDDVKEETASVSNNAANEKIERMRAKDRERKRNARLKGKSILSEENEDTDIEKKSADTDDNSAKIPNLSMDASADTSADISADISEIPFIYIRGEEIRTDKNRIDNSLREEKRDLPPSGSEVDCEARRKEPSLSFKCHSATDCEPKLYACSSTATRSPLPEGAINTPSPQVQKETDKDFLSHTPAGISLAESEYRVCEANISKPSDARLYRACNASPSPSPTPINEGRGIYKNVFISDKEYRALKERYPDSIDRLIEELSTYLKSSGKSYESHSAALSRWAIRDRREKEAYGGKNGFHNSSECGARQNTPSGDSPKGGKEESRLRYGDFDPEEAFQRAVARSLATKIGEQASVPPYSP